MNYNTQINQNISDTHIDIIQQMKKTIGIYSQNILTTFSNKSNLFVYDMFAIQTGHLTNRRLLGSAQDMFIPNQNDIKHKLSIIDLSKCEIKLRQIYNITSNSSFFIKKLDFNSNLNYLIQDNSGSNSTVFELFHPETMEKLDLSKCDQDVNYSIPIKDPSSINISKYFSLNTVGIDIYNSLSDAFNTRCFPNVDTSNNTDTTINIRRLKYFEGRSVNCGPGCTYMGLDIYNYTLCACNQTTVNDSEVSYYFQYDPLKEISNINYDIIDCFQVIWSPKIYINPGFYMFLSSFLFYFLILTIIKFCNNDFLHDDRLLTSMILTDAKYYIKGKMSLKLYFLYRKFSIKLKPILDSPNKPILGKNNNSMDDAFSDFIIVDNNIKVNYNYSFQKDESEEKSENNEDLKGIDLIDKLYKNEKIFPHEFCFNDYVQLSPFEAIIYDKRNFLQIFIDELKEKHSILSIFLKKSLLNPLWLRIVWLYYSINLTLCLSALLFTDDNIGNLTEVKEKTRVNILLIRILISIP